MSALATVAMSSPDRAVGRLTVLQAPGKCLTKVYEHGRKGQIVKRGYDKALWFTSKVAEVENVDALADLLRRLQRHPDACVIMGVPGKWHPGEGRPVLRRIYASHALADDTGRFHKPDRKGTAEVWQQQQIESGRLRPVTVLPAFQEQATRVLLLDFDGISAPAGIEWRDDLAYTASFLRMRLPAEFHNARCVYYATSSAADPTRPDMGGPAIKMRLGFMLDRGVAFAQAKKWLAGIEGLDDCTLRPAQPIYTAAPIFRDGLADPMPERLGVLDGQSALVAVPEITIEQRFKREAFTALGPVRSAEGVGLLVPHPQLDAALKRLAEEAGVAGSVRNGLMRAAFAYIADAGRNHVDIDALAERLTNVAVQYRSADDVAGYGLDGLIAWALERSPDDPEPRPHYPENGLPADEASARLREEMAAAVGAAVAWQAMSATEDDKLDMSLVSPVVALKAGAGIGKTGEAIAQIVAIPGVETMNVEIYVPDHRLAEELAERVRVLVASRRPADFAGIDTNAELRVVVIRGRGAADVDGEPMCQKAELADKIGRAGLNVKDTLCIGAGGLCEFFEQCRYIGQFRDRHPAIRIMAHSAMFARRNRRLPQPDLVVVDEAFWKAALPSKPVRLALDRLIETNRWRVRPRKVPKAKDQTPAELAKEAIAKAKARREAEDRRIDAEHFAIRVHNALLDGLDPRTVVTAEDCRLVAGVEWGSREGPGIEPAMEYAEQNRLWASWQGDECAKAGRFWSLLAAEHEHPERPMQRIVLERDAPAADDDRRHILHLHYRRELMLHAAPVILLDADLDPLIAAKFWPDVRIVEIPVRQIAEIVQVVDKTGAMSWLLGNREDDQRRASNRLAELRTTAVRLLGEGGLLVTYKEALERLAMPPEIATLHLGHLRGRDGFKGLDRIVIAGRLEPSVRAVERMARCLFGDEAEPIATVPDADHGGTRYPTEKRRCRMAGGAAGPAVNVSVHPDPRAHALLEQVRERELEQAVARLRLVHRDRPATVYLLTNIPLNLDVTTVATWSELARDREAEACNRWGGLWLCSASERAKAAPDLWGTAQAAENGWRRRKGVPNPSNCNIEHFGTPFATYPGGGHASARHAVTLVEYRYPSQRGSAHQVLIPGAFWCPDAARASIESVTGTVASVTVIRTVPRTPIVDTGEPEPVHIPIVVHAPFHLIDVEEAWAFAGHDCQRWTLHNSKQLVLPVAMAARFALALRSTAHRTVFTRGAA